MEVILLHDLEGVGTKGATVNVKPGYARNFLLPKRLAISSGTRAGNLYQELERQNSIQREKLVAAARAAAAKLEGVEVNVTAQANRTSETQMREEMLPALQSAAQAIGQRKLRG